MKKNLIFYLPLCILIAGLLFQCSSVYTNHKKDLQETNGKEHYFRKINEIIKGLDFHSAKVKDGKIVLYDKSFNLADEIPFAEYDTTKNFIYAYKDGGRLFFVTHKEDDEYGILFVNDDSDSMMDGVGVATRIGDNVYEYDTICKYMQ